MLALEDETMPKLMRQTVNEVYAERDHLKAINADLLAALVEIEGSGSCYCARDVDGQRLGCKCAVCVARAAIA